MMNATYSADMTIARSREFTVIADREFSVGQTLITNIPGRVGHNYARWEIVKMEKLDETYTGIEYRRVY